MEQTPCPDRFLDDCGGAFAMGCLGGSAWHGIRGIRHAPRGFKNRWSGFADGIRSRAPVLGGQFAVWGGLFAASDCTITHLRGKEDWKNSVAAGAMTSGLLAIRGGLKPFMLNAVIGGLMLGMIEGFGYMISNAFAAPPNQQQEPLLKTSFAAKAKELSEQRAAKQPKKFKETFDEEPVYTLPGYVVQDDLLDSDKFALAPFA